MKFLGVKFKVVDESENGNNLFWTLISSNGLVNQFHQHAKSKEEAIERTKKIILMDGGYSPTWSKYEVGSGGDYYLNEKPFYFRIEKCDKKYWKFEAYEINSPTQVYTNNYCLTICTTLIEAKQKVFKAYQFMSDKTFSNGKSIIIPNFGRPSDNVKSN